MDQAAFSPHKFRKYRKKDSWRLQLPKPEPLLKLGSSSAPGIEVSVMESVSVAE
jgi:hypothetical protein